MIDKSDYGVSKLRTGMSHWYLRLHEGVEARDEVSTKGRKGNGFGPQEEEKGRKKRKLIIQNEILNSIDTIVKDSSS